MKNYQGRALAFLMAKLSVPDLQAVRVGLSSVRLLHLDQSSTKEMLLKIYAGEGEHFTLRKSDEASDAIMYFWDEGNLSKAFVLSFNEALDLLGEGPQQTKSWTEQGYYRWTSSSGLPKDRRKKMVELYGQRWDWIVAHLESKPTQEQV